MARQPKLRVSFSGDHAYLTRLASAIERDPQRTPEWKRQALVNIIALQTLFLEDKARLLKSPEEKAQLLKPKTLRRRAR